MSSARLGVALIGHGLSGAYLHGPLIEAVPELSIRVVSTSRPEGLKLRREPARCIADPHRACCDDEIDLVVIATPNQSHFELARQALGAGKHVVVDKPFTLSSTEADELIRLARQQQRLLSVFHNRRWDGDFLEVQRQLQQQSLGTPLLFEAAWDRFRPQIVSGWRSGAAPGAGLLWDLGPHLIDQTLRLFGTPTRWQADISRQRQGALSDDYFQLTFWYGELRCVLSASMLQTEPRARFGVHGTRGSLHSFGVDGWEAALRAGGDPSAPAFRAGLAPTRALSLVDGQRREYAVPAGHWEFFYTDVWQALRDHRAPAVSAEQARDVVALIEQAHAQSV